jgi:hypothetical protein
MSNPAAQGCAFLVVVVVAVVWWGVKWLYEYITAPVIAIAVGGGLILIGCYLWWREQRANPQAKARQRPEIAPNPPIEVLSPDVETDATTRPDGVPSNRVHVTLEEDGKLSTDWPAQMREIKQAWHRGDYDFARTWLQKLAYTLGTIESGQAPAWVHEKFKLLVAEFTQDDPLYKSIIDRVVPAVIISPGVLQSDLMKALPDVSPEHFRYVLYYAEYRGDIRREKKGRSYALFPAGSEAEQVAAARTIRVARRLTEEALDYGPPMDEYHHLGILLDETIRDNDHEAAVKVARQKAAMSLEIIPWRVRFGTEGIRTKQGWMGGSLIVGVGDEYDYLTGKAFDIGVVSEETAIHCCDDAIKVIEAQAAAIQSYLPTMIENPISLHMALSADIIRDKCLQAVAEDVPCNILRWTEKKTAIAATAERHASIRRLISDVPGCIQSDFRKKHPDITSHDLYYAALRGDIRREKKGRSYALFPTTPQDPLQPARTATKT